MAWPRTVDTPSSVSLRSATAPNERFATVESVSSTSTTGKRLVRFLSVLQEICTIFESWTNPTFATKPIHFEALCVFRHSAIGNWPPDTRFDSHIPRCDVAGSTRLTRVVSVVCVHRPPQGCPQLCRQSGSRASALGPHPMISKRTAIPRSLRQLSSKGRTRPYRATLARL